MNTLRVFIVLYATLSTAGLAGWVHGRYNEWWVGVVDVGLLLTWLVLVRAAGKLR